MALVPIAASCFSICSMERVNSSGRLVESSACRALSASMSTTPVLIPWSASRSKVSSQVSSW